MKPARESARTLRVRLEQVTGQLDQELRGKVTGSNAHLIAMLRSCLLSVQLEVDDTNMGLVEAVFCEFPHLLGGVGTLMEALGHALKDERVTPDELADLEARWERLVLVGTGFLNHLRTVAR